MTPLCRLQCFLFKDKDKTLGFIQSNSHTIRQEKVGVDRACNSMVKNTMVQIYIFIQERW